MMLFKKCWEEIGRFDRVIRNLMSVLWTLVSWRTAKPSSKDKITCSLYTPSEIDTGQ